MEGVLRPWMLRRLAGVGYSPIIGLHLFRWFSLLKASS
jgi:hypothetical protein